MNNASLWPPILLRDFDYTANWFLMVRLFLGWEKREFYYKTSPSVLKKNTEWFGHSKKHWNTINLTHCFSACPGHCWDHTWSLDLSNKKKKHLVSWVRKQKKFMEADIYSTHYFCNIIFRKTGFHCMFNPILYSPGLLRVMISIELPSFVTILQPLKFLWSVSCNNG